jgi:hypothetical protein
MQEGLNDVQKSTTNFTARSILPENHVHRLYSG